MKICCILQIAASLQCSLQHQWANAELCASLLYCTQWSSLSCVQWAMMCCPLLFFIFFILYYYVFFFMLLCSVVAWQVLLIAVPYLKKFTFAGWMRAGTGDWRTLFAPLFSSCLGARSFMRLCVRGKGSEGSIFDLLPLCFSYTCNGRNLFQRFEQYTFLFF